MNTQFIKEYFLPLLKTWKEEKQKEGFIPTLDLLIEDLEEGIKKEEAMILEAQRLSQHND